jgi:MFS family permease
MVAGQIVTVMGSSLLRFALSLYVLDITGRMDIFAALYALSSVPTLLAPIGGAISDRFNRRLLMVLYDAICCVISFLFLFVMLGGYASVPAVGVVMVLLGVVGAMETPNGTACLPLLVEPGKLEASNGIIQAVQSLSSIIAPVLGGILYGELGLTALVAISGAAFGLAAFTEMFIQIPYTKRPQEGGIVKMLFVDLKQGFRYVWNEPLIRKLAIIAALLNMALSPCFLVASPIIFRVTMQGGDAIYGIGMGLINAASILGALSVGIFSKRMRVNTLWRLVLGIALLFIPLAFSVMPVALNIGFWPSFVLFMLCLMLMVAATTILSIFVVVRVQAETPGENLGKVMAIIQAVAQCAAPIGQLLYGFAFEGFKNAAYIPLLIACGATVAIALIGKVMLQNGSFRKAEGENIACSDGY